MESISIPDYDPGFLITQGFGQSATNPKPPVFYESLGVVKDLSVYNSIYATKSLNAGISVNVGRSKLSTAGFNAAVPAIFEEDVILEKNLFVANLTTTQRLVVRGIEFKPTRIVAKNGTFTVLAAV